MTEEQERFIKAVNCEERPAGYREILGVNPPPGIWTLKAPPGSGKTHTVVNLIQDRIARGADPASIAVMTYTVAAGQELRTRLELPEPLGHCGTMHSFVMGLIPRREIIDEKEARNWVKKALEELGLPNRLAFQAHKALESIIEPSGNVGVAVRRVRHLMQKAGVITFDMAVHEALKKGEVGRAGPFDLLVVDEFQDASELDAAVYAEIRAEQRAYVGDPNQAIYEFRGGSPSHFRRAERRGKSFTLTKSFRLRSVIAQKAGELAGVEIVSARTELNGGSIQRTNSIEKIWEWLRERHAQGGRVGVLTRYNRDVDEVAILAKARGLPVKKRALTDSSQSQILAALRYFSGDGGNEGAIVRFMGSRLEKMAGTTNPGEKGTHVCVVHQRLHLKAITAAQALLDIGFSVDEAMTAAGWGEDALTVDEAIEAILSDQAAQANMGREIEVTTIHQAKGREWDHVVFAKANGDIFPASEGMTEDRRLFFVAITRTRGDLLIAHDKGNRSPLIGLVASEQE